MAAAGGFLAEADRGRAVLVRDAGDSVVAGAQWQPAEMGGRRRPGPIAGRPDNRPAEGVSGTIRYSDCGQGPAAGMERIMSTEWRMAGRRSEGRSRGVVAAVLLGNGEVIRQASGNAAGPFQYLYVTMHPDRYGGLLPATALPVSDRESLEDAAALHRYMFRTSTFRAGERTHLPPDGHFRVQAGVWLRPKNAAYPGSGVRKRHYGDGRVWTTFPDGRQRWRFPNGRTVMQFPDKSQETRFQDGSVRFEDALGGIRTTYPDGRIGVRRHQRQQAPGV